MHPISVEDDPDELDAGQFFVEAKFDGVLLKCFLDTGATLTLVKATSFFLAYKNLRQIELSGLSGKTVMASRIRVEKIELGDEELGPHEIARVSDEPSCQSTLGLDLFQKRSIGFELKDQRLVFNFAKQSSHPFQLGQRGHIIVSVFGV